MLRGKTGMHKSKPDVLSTQKITTHHKMHWLRVCFIGYILN